MEKKKIILLGDSIRMGYDKYVKDALADVADVYYPSENCKFAQYTLRFLHEWKNDGGFPADADLVHWNAGLWDVIELFGDEPISTIDYYASVIPRIHARVRMLFPKAKIVFATSTPVDEKRYSGNIFCRHNANIKAYNAAALRALAGKDTLVNDLYALMENAPDEAHSDPVHFNTPLGAQMLGGRVVSVIVNELGIDPADVKLSNFEPDRYTAKNIGY